MRCLFFIFYIFSSLFTNAQVVNIPDNQFKAALINSQDIIDTNNDGEIQVTEAEAFTGTIHAWERQVESLIGIEAFINVTKIWVWNNSITEIDLSQNTALTYLHIESNNLTSIDLSNNLNLEKLIIGNNNLSELNLSSNHLFSQLNASGNNNLSYINLKNGNSHRLYNSPASNFGGLPGLLNVCVDDISNTTLTDRITQDVGHNVNFTEYCSFSPALSNQITGNIKYDINNDGCTNTTINIANLLITSTDGSNSFGTISESDGSYLIYTGEGDYTTSVNLSTLPSYFSINQNSQVSNFTSFGNTDVKDFCISSNETTNDLNISIAPTSEARPGFDASYIITYNNVGTTQLSGEVTITFDDSKLNFLTATPSVTFQTSNSLTFNFTNLNPFESKSINVNFNVFAPPTVNIDEELEFNVTITPNNNDNTPEDNTYILNQTIIGSFDPNDITCIEGNQVLIDKSDEFLHYIIRFQNTGTASAINVVVKNILNENLDWSTFQLESLSHTNRVSVSNGNKIEFIFENINLPDSTSDEPNSHGYITYKIKPKENIGIGEIIENDASIYFDFNLPIETNIALTEMVAFLGISDEVSLNFNVYPIPAKKNLFIKSDTDIINVKIFNNLGQLVIEKTNKNKVDVSSLSSGIYFLKVEDINKKIGLRKIVL
ncbi:MULTISPECIES: DUF7619 domain-containing protein [Tenacibaculum]|uniref:DUF7619 domain-containing protein n=1 Tax=Tenacibaculum TaxID=104267 RepID=UPI001F0A6777|nr:MULTISPECIES: T9SS type A sorting domain-containing protein [Tenacibaculum]MCH3881321.1 T9SS type A sorting domain-containing protein [Tenacibaculum aquimarinum]MDO6599085.1 T9SS type A sorting domain-containing protein [Tenacibaculum sp. 1_MG-2023]